MLQLDDSQIHLWHVQQADFDAAELAAHCLDWLTPAELKRYHRYYFDRHRKQFLLGRMMMRSVLTQYAEVAPQQWRFVENPYGKPSIDPGQRSQPLFFNLSHSADRLVLAISRHEAIGVDIECSNKSRRVLQIADRYFSPTEVIDLEALPHASQLTRFYDLWTLKEAYIKACGLGLAIPLRQFSFGFVADSRITISFARERDDAPEPWQFWQLQLNAPFAVSVAVKCEQREIDQLQSWELKGLQKFESVKTVILRY